MIFPLILVLAGSATILALVLTQDVVPVHEPDIANPPPGSTGYKLVDVILDELKKASAASGVPLGVLVGWIAKESGGKLGEVTRLDERGLFQLMPDESKSLGIDHQRLSTDLQYSINAGLLLIASYMKAVNAMGVAAPGSEYYWKLVKLCHTVGSGDAKTMVSAAKAAGQAGSWATLEQFALSGAVAVKHSPQKWYPFIDALFQVGAPFGVGTGGDTAVVGGDDLPFNDIPDPLALLPKYRRLG